MNDSITINAKDGYSIESIKIGETVIEGNQIYLDKVDNGLVEVSLIKYIETKNDPIDEPSITPSTEYKDMLKVSFYVDDNVHAELYAYEDTSLGGLPTTPNLDNKGAFIGWFVNLGLENEYELTKDTNITAETRADAKFETKTFTVYYMQSDAVVYSEVLEEDATIEDRSSQYNPGDDLHVAYWYIEGGDENTPYEFGSPIKNDLYLQVKLTNKYPVVFISAGTQVPYEYVVSGAKASEPTIPTRTQYTFSHWSLTENGTPFDFDSPITEPTTLYAVWNGLPTNYTIVYWLDRKSVV